MQNSFSGDEKSQDKRVKYKIKYFFKETFRPHSKEEYAEVFTRGLGANCSDNVIRKLPWLYLRVFALNLILFAIITITFRLARFSADYLTAILTGGLLFNIPLFIFFFELYPKRDLSLLKLFAVLLIGGIVSTIFITLGYQYIYSTTNEPNAWISTLWVGFWEELIKGAVAIIAIIILGKKNPLCCFLIGFAVGTGYSFTEDLGYIYSLSRSYGVTWLVLTSVGRGLSCVCSHAPWTAMICWAFAKFRKPFINFRFYGVVIAMMALHYFADVPFFDDKLNVLRGITVGWAIEAVVVVAIFIMVFFALKSCFKELYTEGKPMFPQSEVLTQCAKLSQAANLTAVLCAAILSVFAFAGCCVKTGEKRIYDKIYDDNEFIEYAQGGLPLHADLKREFDADGEIYSEFISEGTRKGATQKVVDAEYEYFYIYYFDDEGLPVLESVGVNLDGRLKYCNHFEIYEDYYFIYYGYPLNYRPVDESFKQEVTDDSEEDGEEEQPAETEEPSEPPVEEPKPVKVVSFFNVNSQSYSYSVDEGCFLIPTSKTEFEGQNEIIALGALAGATLIGGSAAFITLKLKARRKKNA
ncbi:MAG: PrsW family intramembrane metalloprotease [Clostridia bacterium]|nr:PrsW family intramembrane metalloprotease [Clostridia bacterium]